MAEAARDDVIGAWDAQGRRRRLQRFVRNVLSRRELRDGLLLAATAMIVAALLPDRTVDPWQVLNPRKLWFLALLVMAVSAVGRVALHVLGARAGLLLTALAGGFASSTATIAAMGGLARRNPPIARALASAALLSNVGTIAQLAIVVFAIEPALLARIAWPLVASGATISLVSMAVIWRGRGEPEPDVAHIAGRAFEPRQALLFVAIVATALVASAAALEHLGPAALGIALAISGFADVHAAAASAGQLVGAGQVTLDMGALGIAMALVTNSTSKLIVAYATGGRRYVLALVPGLVAMVAVFTGAMAATGGAAG